MTEIKDLKFISRLSNDELITLINISRSSKEPNFRPEVINYCTREYISGGEKTTLIDTGRGRHTLFHYQITDVTMDAYFPTWQKYGSYDEELQTYLTARFGNEYLEFLSKRSLVR